MPDKPITTYCQFHDHFKGKHFLTPSGEVLTKLDVWCMHRKEPTMIKMIINGTDRQYHAVEKPGLCDGILIDKRSYSRNANGELILR